MLTTKRTAARAAAVVALTGALSLLASPALAGVRRDDGDDPGEIMSWGTAFLLFVGVPLAFAGLVWLLVSAPGWTRGGRTGDVDAWTGDPLVLDSDAPDAVEAGAEPPAALGSGDDDAAGGSSARW